MSPALQSLSLFVVVFALLAPSLPSLARTPEEAAAALRSPKWILLRAAEFDVDLGPPPAPADLRLSAEELAAVRYWIVQFRPPLPSSARSIVADRGGEVVSYLPNHAFLVHIAAASAGKLALEEAVSWIGAYRPEYKLAPEIGTRVFRDPDRGADRMLTLSAFPGENLRSLARAAREAGAEVLAISPTPATPRIRVRARGGVERRLARIEGLEWIEELGEVTLRNDTTRWVAQTNVENSTVLHDHGFFGAGEILGHIDGPLAHTSCYFDDANAPIGLDHRKIVAYRSQSGFGQNSHGTHTAGTAAGDSEPVDGSTAQRGMAPKARLSHANVFDVEGFGNTPSNLYEFLVAAHDDGARIHSNSWGDDGFTSYTTWCRDIDRFARDFEDDLVLFSATNLAALRSPENAKNLVSIGASRQAPNQHLHGSGGMGPTADGRRKPELFLPGIGVSSAWPVGCTVVSMSGTSMATPAVAGCAALVREYYRVGLEPVSPGQGSGGIRPSAALLKATLLNGAVDMEGVAGYPSHREGWGRLLLDEALHFPGDARRTVIRDVRNANGLSTGEVATLSLFVSPTMPLKVTMVFTDQPAALGAALAPVNDLDLEIEGPLGVFRGNFFSSGISIPGGTPDNLNNVERLWITEPFLSAGIWTLRVLGTSVPDGPQGYALHVSGDVGAVVPGDLAKGASSGPTSFLRANLPNPFSEVTRIRFALPGRIRVNVAVYDVAGRRVKTLRGEELPAGEYFATWDGRDRFGAKVSDGIYFVRLQGRGLDETRKILLLR